MTTPNHNNPVNRTVGPRRRPQGTATPAAPGAPATPASPQARSVSPRMPGGSPFGNGPAPVQPRRQRSTPAAAPVRTPQSAPRPAQQQPPRQAPAPVTAPQPVVTPVAQSTPQQSHLPVTQPNHQPAPQMNQQQVLPEQKSDRSKISALLFAFILGTVGAHNFYLGYKTKAWWQLGLTVFGYLTLVFLIGGFFLMVTCIWAFIDFFMILLRSGSYGHDVDGRPLR